MGGLYALWTKKVLHHRFAVLAPIGLWVGGVVLLVIAVTKAAGSNEQIAFGACGAGRSVDLFRFAL